VDIVSSVFRISWLSLLIDIGISLYLDNQKKRQRWFCLLGSFADFGFNSKNCLFLLHQFYPE